MPAADKQHLIHHLQAELQRSTGRQYRIDFAALDVTSLGEFARLLRDIATEKQMTVRRAKTMPWKR
jgi:hypothetical protein